jgi:hypothetical protein
MREQPHRKPREKRGDRCGDEDEHDGLDDALQQDARWSAAAQLGQRNLGTEGGSRAGNDGIKHEDREQYQLSAGQHDQRAGERHLLAQTVDDREQLAARHRLAQAVVQGRLPGQRPDFPDVFAQRRHVTYPYRFGTQPDVRGDGLLQPVQPSKQRRVADEEGVEAGQLGVVYRGPGVEVVPRLPVRAVRCHRRNDPDDAQRDRQRAGGRLRMNDVPHREVLSARGARADHRLGGRAGRYAAALHDADVRTHVVYRGEIGRVPGPSAINDLRVLGEDRRGEPARVGGLRCEPLDPAVPVDARRAGNRLAADVDVELALWSVGEPLGEHRLVDRVQVDRPDRGREDAHQRDREHRGRCGGPPGERA